MKILLYGDRSYGGGGWCYANTLRDMGHNVLEFGDWDGLEFYQSQLFWRGFRKLTHAVWEGHRQSHVRALAKVAQDYAPDIIIVLKGLHLSGTNVRALKQMGAWVVNVNHDDFFSQYPLSWSDLQRAAIPEYEFIFTTREVNVGELRPLNAHVEFFPFAYYPRIHRPVTIPAQERSRWDTEVLFVGTYAKHRAWMLEELIHRVKARFAIYGSHWHKLARKSALRPFVCFREVVMDDMAKAFGGARLSLGFLRKENRDDYTQRTFEIPACGGVLVAERTARHRGLYQEGTEAEFFDADNPDELANKVRMLLKDPIRQEAMRAAGRAALLRQRHTYRDRLDRLLELYNCARSGTVGHA